jgi:signal transduction histidine kinase
VIANPASGRDIRRLTTHASVFPTAEKANMVVRLLAGLGMLGHGRVLTLRDKTGVAALLRRALDNLLDNAQKYSEPGTPIHLHVAAASDAILLSVKDRGIGIAAEDIPRVTTPFFRTDRSRARKTGGLGLGLSLAKRIVEAHRGTLHVHSQLGEGTDVHVTLPLVKDELLEVGAEVPGIEAIGAARGPDFAR